MNDIQKFDELVDTITRTVPDFQIKFKKESFLMKVLDKLLFFNKNFLTGYNTTIGKTVYLKSRAAFESNRGTYLRTLCHEYLHIMDYIHRPIRYVLGYIFPQILAIFSLGAFFAFINPWFLLFLLSLLFIAPIPSPGRAETELRGYGMNCKTRQWLGDTVSENTLNNYVDAFTTSAYYFMWPFKKRVEKRLKEYIDSNDCLSDPNPAYIQVYHILNK